MRNSKAAKELDAALRKGGRGAHADLARKLPVSASTLTGWRNGSRAPVTRFRLRLAEVVGTSVGDWDRPAKGKPCV